MEAVLLIYDYVPGGPRAEPRLLRLASERVTVAEIIRRRVAAEVAEYNASESGAFRGLVEPEETERLLNAPRARARRRIAAEAQIEVALDAFRRRGFLLLFDGRQLDGLDAEVALTGDNEITFLKLVPLVGG
jgi:hypothetical protein